MEYMATESTANTAVMPSVKVTNTWSPEASDRKPKNTPGPV